MNLGSLKYADGSRKKRKRVGRGQGSGHGGTSCRGNNGQRSRSGSKIKAGFEGGQTPIQRRLPKRGFTNIFKKIYQVLNLSEFKKLEGEKTITPEVLYKHRLINKMRVPVKILGDGEIGWAAEVSAHAFSKTAIEKIESAKGKVTIL